MSIINTNIPAINAHKSLSKNSSKKGRVTAKLSSGLRVNSAADDAAGLAISEKMRTQIRGLEKALNNVEDAINLLKTGDGGLGEIADILQRVRALSIKAANDTNEQSDREKIQMEVEQLLREIDALSEKVEFNKINLLGQENTVLIDSTTDTDIPIKSVTTAPQAHIEHTNIVTFPKGTPPTTIGESIEKTVTGAPIHEMEIGIDIDTHSGFYEHTTGALETEKLYEITEITKTTIETTGTTDYYEKITKIAEPDCAPLSVTATGKPIIMTDPSLPFPLDIAGDISCMVKMKGDVLSEVASNIHDDSNVLILLDVTGSMGTVITNLKNSIKEFSQQILDKNAGSEFAVIAFGDRLIGEADDIHGFTNDLSILEGYLSAIPSHGGGDTPETPLHSIWDAINTGGILADTAITNAKRIILITDAEAHTVSGVTIDNIISKLNAEGVDVDVIGPLSGSAYTQLSKLSSKTGGHYYDIYDMKVTPGGPSGSFNLYNRSPITTILGNTITSVYTDGYGLEITQTIVFDPDLNEYEITFDIDNKGSNTYNFDLEFSIGAMINSDVNTALVPDTLKITAIDFKSGDPKLSQTATYSVKFLTDYYELSDAISTEPTQIITQEVTRSTDIYAHKKIYIQSGANAGQGDFITLFDLSTKRLGINDVNVTTRENATVAIKKIDLALEKVNIYRAYFGAKQNRFEHTTKNIGTSAENISSSESRIRDADMAREMMEYVRLDVLEQASTAILAQANQTPQSVLQLLESNQ